MANIRGCSASSPEQRRRAGHRQNAAEHASFPSDQRELCLATAWRLIEEGQTVLIFCPERRSVDPYAECDNRSS